MNRFQEAVCVVQCFVAGVLAGMAIQALMAQNPNGGVGMMNHVGINVSNVAEAVTYYTHEDGLPRSVPGQ